MAPRETVFISHAAVDGPLANFIGSRLSGDFLGGVDTFVSSRPEDNQPGEVWYDTITSSLLRAKIIVVLANKSSVERPWINFEAGVGVGKGIPIVPLCCGGLMPSDIEGPIGHRQGLSATNPADLRTLYRRVAKVAEMEAPSIDFERLAEEVASYKVRTFSRSTVEKLIGSLDTQIPDFISEMKTAKKKTRLIFENLNSTQIPDAQVHLRVLKNFDLLNFDWQFSHTTIMAPTKEEQEDADRVRMNSPLGGSRNGDFYALRIDPSDELIDFAQEMD